MTWFEFVRMSVTRERVAAVVQVVGLVFVVGAAFAVSAVFGAFVAGVALVALGLAVERGEI